MMVWRKPTSAEKQLMLEIEMIKMATLKEVRRQVKSARESVAKELRDDWTGWPGDTELKYKGAIMLEAEINKRLDKMER